ncbi:type II secretion system secretin GspD [Caenimonas terrae]|uniref:Type II secretion system secretin GspD n=1 Tax=Caenimonas terrae TaxID=696074 RepID=A0ABW0NMD0_9BURK
MNTVSPVPTVDKPNPQPINGVRIIRGTDRVVAPAPAAVPLTGTPNTFRFEDAPLLDVVHIILRDILKVDYMIHPPVTGTVTLATKGDISPDDAAYLLESALLANGLVMAQDSRGTYHVGRPEALRGFVSAPRQAGNGPLQPGFGAVIVPLKYIGAAEMATILRPMLPPESLLRVDTVRNLLVLAGTRTQAEGWLSIVSTFDVDLLKGMSVGLFPLKYASVQEVEAAMRMLSSGGRPAATGAPTPPGSPADAAAALAENPFFGALRIMPIERLNSILVVTPKAAYLEDARRWIERLDRPGLNLSEQVLHVYPVQNGSARHLAEVLNGIFGSGEVRSPTATGVAPGLNSASASTFGSGGGGMGIPSGAGGISAVLQAGQAAGAQAPAPSATPLRLGSIRVVADEVNNSVLVYGTALEFAKIESALRRLDLPPTQVLIEASIVEVTLTDDLQYGLQWTFNDAQSNGKVGTSVLSSLAGGVLGGPLAGFSYTLRNSAGNVRAVLNALADKSLVKVISSPSLMVMDNHTAQIVVGNQQPVQSGQTITTGGVISNSIVYKDTGVALAVTPSVNSGNMVTMTINQAVTDVGQIDTATGQRAFLQRQINSKVAVRSGETLVLGGLIRDNSTTGSSGIPLLHEIPILGGLFGTKNSNGQRTELLVIITPKVVRSDDDARDVSAEMRDRMKSFTGYKPFGALAPAGAAPAIPLPADPNAGGPNSIP